MTFFSGGKKNYLKKYFFLHISSSYAKILGETNFQPREFPRRGWKAEGVEKEEEKRRWKQWPALLPPSPLVAHASTSGPKGKCNVYSFTFLICCFITAHLILFTFSEDKTSVGNIYFWLYILPITTHTLLRLSFILLSPTNFNFGSFILKRLTFWKW